MNESITPNQLKRLFPHASKSLMEKNSGNQDPGPAPKLESNPRPQPLAAPQVQAHARRCLRIKSVRRRLIDEDNICEKYLVDLLRLVNIISDDNPEQTTIITSQRKAAPDEQEHTLIEVYVPIEPQPKTP